MLCLTGPWQSAAPLCRDRFKCLRRIGFFSSWRCQACTTSLEGGGLAPSQIRTHVSPPLCQSVGIPHRRLWWPMPVSTPAPPSPWLAAGTPWGTPALPWLAAGTPWVHPPFPGWPQVHPGVHPPLPGWPQVHPGTDPPEHGTLERGRPAEERPDLLLETDHEQPSTRGKGRPLQHPRPAALTPSATPFLPVG